MFAKFSDESPQLSLDSLYAKIKDHYGHYFMSEKTEHIEFLRT